MPWRGPQVPGEFPSLGHAVGAWIEQCLIIPDGPLRGQPYLLTDEMWRHLIWTYRLHPDARPGDGNIARVYYGAQLRRVQKWGKDPFGAAQCAAQALGPVYFSGWDADGEPVGKAMPTPWVQVLATSEAQCVNTWRPLYTMLHDGPLCNTPGLDIGETRIKLPDGDGWLEPVATSMKSRLGARTTFVSITEPHLMSATDGGLDTIKAVKRNLAGMNGTWVELTNNWDPSQRSVAQRTFEARRPGVFLDHRPELPPLTPEEKADDETLLRRIIYVYGDSARSNGGWVHEPRIMEDIRAEDTGEAEGRRYFLDESVVGSHDAVDPIKWDALAMAGDVLKRGERIAIGFDGSRRRDATTLVAVRIRDMRVFHLRTWEPPDDPETPWEVPRVEVDDAVTDAFAAYEVWYLYGDPHRWENYMDTWSGRWPKRVVEFDTRSEQLMDRAIERFDALLKSGELTHDGNEVLGRHAKNCALADGKRKPEREPGKPEYYRRLVKKKPGHLIDAFVACVLAVAAAGQAIEDGALRKGAGPEVLEGSLMAGVG